MKSYFSLSEKMMRYQAHFKMKVYSQTNPIQKKWLTSAGGDAWNPATEREYILSRNGSIKQVVSCWWSAGLKVAYWLKRTTGLRKRKVT